MEPHTMEPGIHTGRVRYFGPLLFFSSDLIQKTAFFHDKYKLSPPLPT